MDNDNTFQSTRIYYRQETAGVTDEDGRLVITGLKKLHLYKLFDCFQIEDLKDLAHAGVGKVQVDID